VDVLLNHGDKISFGGQEIEAVETPGHTAGQNGNFRQYVDPDPQVLRPPGSVIICTDPDPSIIKQKKVK
jgi:hypothetical protein